MPPRLRNGAEQIHQFADLGGFAEAMLLHHRAVVKIDKEIPLDRAALVGCAVTTGVGAALNTAKVTPGSSVAVFGCGRGWDIGYPGCAHRRCAADYRGGLAQRKIENGASLWRDGCH